MGLNVSHDCWDGPYSSFGEWRSALFDAVVPGGPRKKYAYIDELDKLPMADPLHAFFEHSDCEGSLSLDSLLPLAARLEEIGPRLTIFHRATTARFAAGLRKAHEAGEAVEFG